MLLMVSPLIVRLSLGLSSISNGITGKPTFFMKKYIVLCLIGLLSSCTDIVDYPNPSAYDASNYFTTPASISEAVTATYGGLYFKGLFQHQWHVIFDGLGNEFDVGPGGANEADAVQAWNYTLQNTNGYLTTMWKSLYRIILRANLAIDKGNEVYAKTNDPTVARLIGEAKFMRAWAYFQLGFHWGRVPLRTSFDQTENTTAKRAPVEDIWKQVQTDLEAAIAVLPDKYTGNDIGRVTKGAAVALLGKKYLYNKDYVNAEAQFAKLDKENGGVYDLLPGNQWSDNFGEINKNNIEGVFEVQHRWFANSYAYGSFVDNQEATATGQPSVQTARAQLYGFNDWANWKFSPQRVKEFVYTDEAGKLVVDPRAALTFYGRQAGGDTLKLGDLTWCDQCKDKAVQTFDFAGKKGFWFRKYQNYETKSTESLMQTNNNYRLIRYADVLLMRAEALIFQNKVTEGVALMNRVRTRIGAFPYTKTYSQTEAFELLKRERVLELVGEEHRYNDLVRWGIAKQVLNAELQQRGVPASFEDKHVLLPIPLQEIDTNSGVKGDVKNNWN